MKDSQIRVCGRAAQTDSGAGGAVMFGCLAAAAVSGGFMTAGAQRLRSDLRAIFGVKAAQPRRQCGGVHFADHSRLGSHRAAAAGDEAVFPARRAGAKTPRRRMYRSVSRQTRLFCAPPAYRARGAEPCFVDILSPAGRGSCGGRDIYASFVNCRHSDDSRCAHGEHTHAYIGLHILLRRAAGVVGGGVYSRRRSGCFDKTGSAPKPRYHARALPRFRPIQGGIYSLVSQLRINSARIFRRSVLRPVLRGVDDGDLGFQK